VRLLFDVLQEQITNLKQGSSSVLPLAQSIPLSTCARNPKVSCVFWYLCTRMDWRSSSHIPNQATGWKHASVTLTEMRNPANNLYHSSFFQSVCIIGYTLFPLVIASLLSALFVPVLVRIPVYIVLILWSLAAGVSILGGSGVVKNRVALAIFPLLLFYVGLGCLCLIS